MKRNHSPSARARAAIFGLAAALLAPAAVEAATPAKAPQVVPMPAPPPGPAIRKVSHDALDPVLPGARVHITVLTVAGMKVVASLGSVESIPCAPVKGSAGDYACEGEVAAGTGEGPIHVRATVTDAKGRSSSLGSALPVVVGKFDPWKEPNALNMRLVPAYFDAGSAVLSAEATADLAKDADSLKAHARLPILVEGHADAGESGDLFDLSSRRAAAVRDFLAAHGVPKERISVKAVGSVEPVGPKGDEESVPLNRRAMVLFQPAAPPAPAAGKP